MDVGKFLCKIGRHKGEPVIPDDESDEVENQQTLEEFQRREVKCVRCGFVYTEVSVHFTPNYIERHR